MLIASALSNMEKWNRASCDPKTQHLASSVSARACERPTIPIDT